MTQGQWLVLALKIGIISGFASLIQWVVVYSLLEKWWRHQVGWSLVTKTGLLALLLLNGALALFLNFDRLTSDIAGWLDAGYIALITPVMIWRSVVWIRLSRMGEDGEHPGHGRQ